MTGSQELARPHSIPATGVPTSPSHSSSCSPPCAHEQQLPTWRGGQRAEVGGLFAKTTTELEAALRRLGRTPPLVCLAQPPTNSYALGPRFSLPCAPPSRGPREKGRGWLRPALPASRRPHLVPCGVLGCRPRASTLLPPLVFLDTSGRFPAQVPQGALPGAPHSLGVTGSAPRIQPHPDSRAPVNVALFGRKSFADVISIILK